MSARADLGDDRRTVRALLVQVAAERAHEQRPDGDPVRCCRLAELESRLLYRLATLDLAQMRARACRPPRTSPRRVVRA
jgi:hypothetical protein